LDSTYIGLWNDGDLGFAFDDYVGYDSSYNMAIYYNGDSIDETASGYGTNLTQTGIILIGGPRVDNPNYPGPGQPQYLELPPSSFTYYNNIPNSKTGGPTIAAEYYHYLTGRWKDGSSVMAGCNPESNTGIPNYFVFPDDPSIANGISEKTCNRPPNDRKTLLSSGPYKLIPGIVPSDITFAIVNTNTGVNNANFNELRRLADSAYKYADGCQSNFWALNVSNISEGQFMVYPNPSNSYFIVEDANTKHKNIQLFNTTGQVVYKSESIKTKTEIKTEQLPRGLYYLQIEKGKKQFSQSILLK